MKEETGSGKLGWRIRRAYTSLAIILLNSVLFVLLVEAIAQGIVTVNPLDNTLQRNLEVFKDRMVSLTYYQSQDWSREYWDEHVQVADHWEYTPYTIWRTLPFSGEHINVGANGLRLTPDSNCGAETYRVYVFGGSAVWGFGVPDSGTIAAFLQDRMGERDVCVVNYGELAYNSTQDLIQLIQLLEHGDAPDMAIFYGGINEVTNPGRTGTPGSHFYLEDISPVVHGGLVRDEEKASTNLLGDLAAQTASCRLAGCAAEANIDWVEAPFAPQFITDIAGIYRQNLRVAASLAAEYDFAFYAFIQPTLPALGRDYNAEEQMLMWNIPGSLGPLLQAVYPEYETLAVENDYLYYFGNKLDDQPYPIWLDYIHVSTWGNLAIAHEITQIVRPVIDAELESRTTE